MSHGDISVGRVFGRIASVFIFAAPATYLMIESRGHRKESRRSKRYALEMVALSPFLAALDENARKAKIEILADKYFGRIEDEGKKQDVICTPHEKFLQLCEKLLEKREIDLD